MIQRLRRSLKRLIRPWYLRSSGADWETERLRVLVECWSGFTEPDWKSALEQEFSDWPQFAELRFVRNSIQRELLIPHAQVYVGTWLSVDLLERALQLRWIHLVTAGVESLEGLRLSPQIQITTSGGIASSGIAEHIVMLMLALDRRLDLAVKRQHWWIWRQDGILQNVRGLRGRTVGVVGLGNNGRAIAELARALGMSVIGVSRNPDLDLEGVSICWGGLPELLPRADFVVLCLPLNAHTRRSIGEIELRLMRPDAYLINVARGELVDEPALARALRRGEIAGAALDVISAEPPPFFHPLRGCPNLIITPHVAGNIFTFRKEIQKRFARNLKALVNERPLEGTYRIV